MDNVTFIQKCPSLIVWIISIFCLIAVSGIICVTLSSLCRTIKNIMNK